MNIPTTALFSRLSAFALIAFSFFSARGADDLDSFLSTPIPPTPISESLAKATLEKGAALMASDSSRQEEIRAYLIPFQRVLPVPEHAEAAPSPANPANPKPFLIFKSSDGVAECFRALTFTTDKEIISARGPDGNKGIWQKSRLAAQLPWYSDAELDQGNIDLEALAIRYKVSVPLYPAIQESLEAEVGRIESIIHKHQETARQKLDQLNEAAGRVISQAKSYSPGNAYTAGDLARMILEAEQVRQTVPEQAGRIDKAMAPFRTHFENLLRHQVLVNGTWQSQAELDAKIAERHAADLEAALEKEVRVELNALSVSQADIRLIKGVFLAALLIVFGIGLYFVMSSSAVAGRALGVLICATPATVGIYLVSLLFATNTSTPSFTPGKPPGPSKVLRVLHLASRPEGAPISDLDRRVTLREADLNSFLREYVHFIGAPISPNAAIYRSDLAVQLRPDRFIVWEISHFKTRRLRVRYEIKTTGIGADMEIAEAKVVIGNLTLPEFLAKPMLRNLLGELGQIKKDKAVLEAFKITRLTEGEMDLSRNRKTKVATNKPVVAAAPASASQNPNGATTPGVNGKKPAQQTEAVPVSAPVQEPSKNPDPQEMGKSTQSNEPAQPADAPEASGAPE